MSRGRAVLVALMLALAAAPGAAHADFGIAPGSFAVSLLDANGSPELRAGAHPDRLVTRFAFNTLPDGSADGNVKDVVIDLPPGFAGDPGAVTPCARAAFVQQMCDAASQVGELRGTFVGLGTMVLPLYNVVPREDQFAEFAAIAVLLPVRLAVRLRDESDYGVQIRLLDVPQGLPLTAVEVELWGVPADHQPATVAPRRSLLTNATSCEDAPAAAVRVRSWLEPDRWIEATSAFGGALAGCDELAFRPALSAALDTPVADTPSGLAIDVALPQDDDPDGRATSQAAHLTATLPGGLTLSPGVARGLAACDDERFGLGSAAPPACPDAATLGTVELTTPVLPAPLTGSIWLARPLPSSRFRLFVAVAGRALQIKLGGALRPDAASGRLTVALDGLPALPFANLRLHFKDGPRAPLATPPTCGPAAIAATVAPRRGGAPARLATALEVSEAPAGGTCSLAPPFAPGFVAGAARTRAGAATPFAVTVTRGDGQQTLERMAVTLPPGVGARLASVAPCPLAAAARAACPAASRVGRVAVEAGAGALPLPLAGEVHLTEARAGAPFGLALVLDGRAGPVDLGVIVVPATLRIDPLDARVTVATDPLPQLVGGIPLRLRTLALDIDRRDFVRNATSCEPSRATAVFRSPDATRSGAAARYALGGCDRLRFTPRVALALGPRGELRRGGRPAVTIALRSKARHATVRSAAIALPRVLVLDPPLTTTVCTQLRARDGRCPRASAVGTARVRTPLLPRPLAGAVNVVQPRTGALPELWATVRGAGVRLSVRATAAGGSGRALATRFVELPDVPLTSLRLTLDGGPGGLLRLSRGLCAPGTPVRGTAQAALRGHNGAVRRLRVRARLAC